MDLKRKALSAIHDGKSLVEFVIPGLTRNPVFSWIPAFAGMTPFAAIYVAVYKTESIPFDYDAMLYALCLPAGRQALCEFKKIGGDTAGGCH